MSGYISRIAPSIPMLVQDLGISVLEIRANGKDSVPTLPSGRDVYDHSHGVSMCATTTMG